MFDKFNKFILKNLKAIFTIDDKFIFLWLRKAENLFKWVVEWSSNLDFTS